jgi:hypothetical protein
VGRASNRKKARRRAGPGFRQAGQGARAGAAARQALPQLAAGSLVLGQESETRGVQQDAAGQAWWGAREPVPAVVPRWPEDSLGHRLYSGVHLARAQSAPCLLTADVPEAAVILGDPANWSVAAGVLVRAVAFDGLRADHPAVSKLADVLAPVAEAELAHGEAIEKRYCWSGPDEEEGEPEFPELDGPVFLIGTCALVDATLAMVGEDPLGEVLAVLARAAEGIVPGLAGGVIADALVGAAAVHCRWELPGDAAVLERIGRSAGNALENLVAAGAVPPADVIRAGLTVLSALAELGQNCSPSVLRLAA